MALIAAILADHPLEPIKIKDHKAQAAFIRGLAHGFGNGLAKGMPPPKALIPRSFVSAASSMRRRSKDDPASIEGVSS
ncbi:hypothetical protein JCM17846_29510 [Iodidimonas nitroreducens]|uniref:Uncharacterized protein n=1 Tax=Iodidimonas nitroreducens TaxID=1236968 RepID=A0A5A7NDY5_9PROT|nr:hypothetical protein JCM17846_29510 [Iodidimonas nitroreducens]